MNYNQLKVCIRINNLKPPSSLKSGSGTTKTLFLESDSRNHESFLHLNRRRVYGIRVYGNFFFFFLGCQDTAKIFLCETILFQDILEKKRDCTLYKLWCFHKRYVILIIAQIAVNIDIRR